MNLSPSSLLGGQKAGFLNIGPLRLTGGGHDCKIQYLSNCSNLLACQTIEMGDIEND